jgi:hypothetical protein
MTAETLRTLIHAAPFRPFHIHLADGQRVPVRHPDFIALSGSRVAVVIQPDESTSYIDAMLVTAMEVDSPPSSEGCGPSDPFQPQADPIT